MTSTQTRKKKWLQGDCHDGRKMNFSFFAFSSSRIRVGRGKIGHVIFDWSGGHSIADDFVIYLFCSH